MHFAGNRTILHALLAGTALFAAAAAHAQSSTLVFAGPGGATEERYRKEILPAFEKEHSVTVQYVAANSAEILAKLEAQRNNQEYDLVLLPDSTMLLADQRGLCAPLAPAPVYDELVPEAKFSPNSVGVSSVYSVIAFNKDVFADRGLPEPTSWLDLGKEEYQGEMSLLSIGSSSTGMNSLVMVARANGGGEANIDPGFTFFEEKIAPNLITVAQSSSKLSEMLQTGEASIGVVISSRASELIDGGAPIKAIVPKEGGPIAMTVLCPVTGAKNPEVAQQLLQYLVSVDGQQGYPAGEMPVNKAVAAVGGAEGDLVMLDLAMISANRDVWIDRWNREIER